MITGVLVTGARGVASHGAYCNVHMLWKILLITCGGAR